ncbi:hypothetical protein NDU88_007543 [Pleurodeles waltl]|uniref:Uncharacterized protein n=1 Tax=Pleurodeles waltl TaxID=8319 RepID=A0AAV7VU49_PLEWA|nr:hypothetical protein NDU88_007543 [Pleurodeles waltl]
MQPFEHVFSTGGAVFFVARVSATDGGVNEKKIVNYRLGDAVQAEELTAPRVSIRDPQRSVPFRGAS